MRTLAIAVFVVLGTLPLGAQQFFIGLKAGLNSSGRNYDTPVETKSRTGATGGISFTYGLTDVIGTRLELLYSPKGDRLEQLTSGVNHTSTLLSYYVDVPIVLVARTAPVLGMRPNIFAGPVFGFHVASDVEGDGSQTLHRFDAAAVDLGFTVGGGVAFFLGTELFGVDARYTFGIGNSIDDTNNEPAPKVTNNTFSLMGAYFFRF